MTAHPGLTGSPAGPRSFNARVAQPARVYDYWLGGKDNFQADRIAGEETIAAYPAIRSSARSNRAFLARTVSYLAGVHGIRQFLDIGAGLPTAPNTHEVAQSIQPASRVVYADSDPMVLSHARALLASGPQGVIACVEADLRDTDTILKGAARILDFTRPVAILLIAVLHFIPDADDPYAVVARLMDAVPSGSYLVIAHAAADIAPEASAEMARRYNQMASATVTPRTRDQVARFFTGLDLLPPGLVPINQWALTGHIDATTGALVGYSAIARKP